MSSAGAHSARRSAAVPARIMRAWRQLTPEQRVAAVAALGLFLTLFLPWYQETVIASTSTKVKGLMTASESLNGWQAFSWVEAAVLLVAVGVLVLLFERAEGRAFHLPGGDGSVITVAGAWTCMLVIWRIFDKEGTSNAHVYATASGVDWGIFIALGVAGLLTYAGTRIRASRQPEPPLPGEDGAVFDGRWHQADEQHGGPARGPAAGRGAPASRRRRDAAAATARSAPEPPSQDPSSSDSEEDLPAREPDLREERRERAGGRSSWRPADSPEWSEPERPVGWLTAPPGSAAQHDQVETQRPAPDDETQPLPPRPFRPDADLTPPPQDEH